MKKLLIISILMICLQGIRAQKIDTVYYNTNWKGVQIRELATYMRIAYISKDLHYNSICRDFFISGELYGETTPIHIDKYDDNNSKFKGHFVHYFKSGKIEGEGNRNESGMFDGECNGFYENGNKRIVGNYKNGVLIGEFNNYFENGKLSQLTVYDNGDAKSSIGYYENGNIKGSCNMKNGQPDGQLKNYNENGKLNELYVYANGIVQSQITYYESGAIKFKTSFKNEKVNGTFFQYLEDGSGHYETEMLDGEKVNNYMIFVDKKGNHIKYNIESKEEIKD